jgi:hypothetical protein
VRVDINHHRRLHSNSRMSSRQHIQEPRIHTTRKETEYVFLTEGDNGTPPHLVGGVLALAKPVQLQRRAVPRENLIRQIEQRWRVSTVRRR